ncbi:MAG: VCBS repeat-containing protein [Pseudomonadota bacterium]
MAAAAGAQADIIRAEYAEPTSRYAHGVLGDDIEYGALLLKRDGHPNTRFILPETRVFEDVAPRLHDVDGDGDNEVIVVESEAQTGAQLAIYDESGKIAATPHIGTRNRWLAPIGVADLDGDGFVEVAYIDRPHLAKTLRVWRFKDGALTPVADLAGLSNHRIGERDIGGGIRDCGTGPELITASANWRDVMATVLRGGQLTTRRIGNHSGRASLKSALECK